jgi:hypothetical protein
MDGRTEMQADRDITKLIVDFRNFAKELGNVVYCKVVAEVQRKPLVLVI